MRLVLSELPFYSWEGFEEMIKITQLGDGRAKSQTQASGTWIPGLNHCYKASREGQARCHA